MLFRSGLPDSPCPLRRFEDSVRCRADRRRPRCPSHEVDRSTECCERRGCKHIGFLAPTMARPFPGKSAWCHLDAVPRPLASSGSSSRELDLLFRVLTAPNLPTRKVWTPSLGFSSPSRHQQREFTGERASQVSLFGPPSAFLTLSTVYSSLCLAGLFRPATTSGISLSGVCTCYRA